MKTKMKRQGSSELPRFVVGALATAGVSAASGATVQISFANNVVSSVTGLIDFTADLTDDNVADLAGGFGSTYAAILVNAVRIASAGVTASNNLVRVAIGELSTTRETNGDWIGAYEFTFTDDRLNGGAPTTGWLDLRVTAFKSLYFEEHKVKINRLIFDDAGGVSGHPFGGEGINSYPEWVPVAAVPEPGSNLALLALGAGGLTLRRRLKRAA